MTLDNKRISRFTILNKYGSDCRTWIEEVTSSYPDEEGKKEAVFVIEPNVNYPIMLTNDAVKELKERLEYFLRGYK